jgi:teichoic acid transport system permease protein
VEGEPDVLGTSQTEAITRQRRKELRASRREARRRHRRARAEAAADDEILMIYEPHVRFVPPLRPYFRDLWDRRAFAAELARSKVKGARSNTVLGSLWALIDPLFMVCLYYFLFTVLRGGSRPESFIPIIVSGILHFQVSAGALNEGGNSVSASSHLMLNSTFPRMLLPISSVYGGLLKFLPSVPIIFFAAILLDAEVGPQMAWWFVLFPLQVAIGLGLALAISTAVVFFRDIKNVLTYVSRIMFFTSPIIYPIALLDQLPEGLQSTLRCMPFFGIFANYQHIISGEQPETSLLLISVSWGIGTLLVGSWLFLRFEREFTAKL